MKNKSIHDSINFFWEETSMELFSSRALFIHDTKELLISDVHLGKAEYFQINGIPLTNNEDESNLERIHNLVVNIKPSRLIILGDLFHSKYSLNINLINKFETFAKSLEIEIILIEGNHDKGCYVKNISYYKNKKSLNLIFSHKPIKIKEKNFLNICGHYHPKLYLKNYQDKLSFRCFALNKDKKILYLPAFGDLTGGYQCNKNFNRWALITANKIIEV